MGNRFPTAAQNPYFNMNAFAYPASYTIGSLGARVLQAPGLCWMQCFATKSWSRRGALQAQSPAGWAQPAVEAARILRRPNTTYNLNNPGALGRFTGVVGDFSNFGTAQANVQASIRVEF